MDYRFTIDVRDVLAHEGSWVFPISQEWSQYALQGCDIEAVEEPGRLEVRVTKAGQGFLVQGRVQLTVAATCVRCLQPVRLEVDAPITALFVPGPARERPGKAETDEDDGEDQQPDSGPDVEYFQDHRLTLDPYVRDTILLELPMNPRCDVECKLPERPRGAS